MKITRLRTLSIALPLILLLVGIFLLYSPKPSLPDGVVEQKNINVAGLVRTYQVVVPPDLKAGASVLFAFHSSQSNADEMRRTVGNGLESIAAKRNTIVVYPDGYEGHFNDCRLKASYSARTLKINDIGFVEAIIKQLLVDKKIDPKHVYAMGYSNGGSMALRLALEKPDWVQGVASFAAHLPTDDNMACVPVASLPRTLMLVSGTKDPISPYDGGPVTLFGFGNRGDVLSAQKSAQWFAEKFNANQSQQKTWQSNGLVVHEQNWMSGSGQVRLISVVGAGHTVPQADYRYPRIFGRTLRSNAVFESMFELFNP